MKIFYNSQEYEIKAFIAEYLKNHNPQPNEDFISQIADHKKLKEFIKINSAKTLQFDASKNEDAVNGIKNATVKLNLGTVGSICDEAVIFGKQFLSLFGKLEEYKAPEQQEQNQQNPQVAEELPENLEEKYNFSIPLGVNPAEQIKRFRVVNKANGGADGGNKIFTDELEKVLYCTAKALYVDTKALKENLENTNVKVKNAWWGILSKLGFYLDRDDEKIKITDPSEKGQNNADTIGKEGLSRPAIKQAIEAEEAKRKEEEAKREEEEEEVKINKFPQDNTVKLGLRKEELNKPEVNVHQLFQNLNNINFDAIEISKKTFTFDVKKYGSLFEIVAEDEKNGGSYRFQLDEASANQQHYQVIYGSIQGKNDGHDFKADEEIQKTLNGLLEAKKIQKSNFFNNDVKKDAIINNNAEVYSYSYYRDAKKNTDINVNFGFLKEDIKNQNDFEELIYKQGVKSEFFVKVNDNNGEYVKFSLYWDEDKGKPAIHLAKSLNGNIDLYGSNHELCGSVTKDNAKYFKDIKVSFQLYYNRGKIKDNYGNDKYDNKALCFVNDTEISKFFDSSKASDLDLNSPIVTNAEATKKITAKDRSLTQDEKNVEIEKINDALEEGLKNAFSVEQNGVVNPLIASINAFVKDKNAVMPDGIEEVDKQLVNDLKERYQKKLILINEPANLIDNQKLNSKSKNFTANLCNFL